MFFTEFVWVMPRDYNRALDALRMRESFINETHVDFLEYRKEFLSVFEIMVSLATKCEIDIMQDEVNYGDRTGLWFSNMLNNLGLEAYDNENFNEVEVDIILTTFINREYEADGHGSLFTTRNHGMDMREIDIWRQLMIFLDENYSFNILE